jgi:hypothetical protein
MPARRLSGIWDAKPTAWLACHPRPLFPTRPWYFSARYKTDTPSDRASHWRDRPDVTNLKRDIGQSWVQRHRSPSLLKRHCTKITSQKYLRWINPPISIGIHIHDADNCPDIETCICSTCVLTLNYCARVKQISPDDLNSLNFWFYDTVKQVINRKLSHCIRSFPSLLPETWLFATEFFDAISYIGKRDMKLDVVMLP